MEFLVGLSKFVKRIRKNKIYRWTSYIICVAVGFKVYCYLHEIIAHTIIHTPVWMWGIIPVITILVLLLTIGIKKRSVLLSIFGGGCFGIVITGILSILFYTTNYWFASSQTYHLDAYIIGTRYIERHGGYRRFSLSKYYVNLKFVNSKELFHLDDPRAYKKFNQGDTVRVSMVKGLYGIPIIMDLSSK